MMITVVRRPKRDLRVPRWRILLEQAGEAVVLAASGIAWLFLMAVVAAIC